MKMPFKTCAVVQANTFATLMKELERAKRVSPMVEIRADSVRGLKEEHVDILKRNLPAASVFTFRHAKEGGLYKGDVKQQKNILKKAFYSGFTYIDVAHGNALVKDLSAREKKKLMLSYHDFSGTPSHTSLQNTLTQMRKASPAVIKIATMVKSEDDILALAQILKEKEAKEKFIIIGMGEGGGLTRVIFPMMGSYVAYVSTGAKKIAPGLMSYEQMQHIYNFITKT